MVFLWIMIVCSILIPTIKLVKAYSRLKPGSTLIDLFKKVHWLLFIPFLNVCITLICLIAGLMEFIQNTPIK